MSLEKLESGISVEDWGLVPYRDAFNLQEDYVDHIMNRRMEEKILFCTHPPVVTLGRGTKPGDVFAWEGETVQVNRGGRATYHGPNQLIMYPLIYIGEPSGGYLRKKLLPKDLHQYIRALEDSVISLLQEIGVNAEGRSMQQQVGEEAAAEATGVWVNNRKVASIGIAVRKWVTSHGVALNIHKDPSAFQGLNPCGFQTSQMTSLEELTGKKWSREMIKEMWLDQFLKIVF